MPRTTSRLLSVLGAVLVFFGAALGARVAWFYHHSAASGAALVRQAQAVLPPALVPPSAAAAAAQPACTPAPAKDASRASGLLVAPSIALTAPVVEGTSNASLDVAVGHLPASVWPGEQGTSVLSAHDVTWFSRLDHLHPGDEVRYETSCGTWTFRVADSQVVRAGTPVLSGSSSRLALVTCYPLNALYFTDKRYVVEADLVGTWVPDRPMTPDMDAGADGGAGSVGVSGSVAALAAQMTHVTQGSLHITGSPDPAWLQSNAPLDAAHAVIQAQSAAMLAAKLGTAQAWDQLGARVTRPGENPLTGATYVSYPKRLDVTLQVDGDQVVAASTVVSAQVRVGGATKTIPISASFAVIDGLVVLDGWNAG